MPTWIYTFVFFILHGEEFFLSENRQVIRYIEHDSRNPCLPGLKAPLRLTNWSSTSSFLEETKTYLLQLKKTDGTPLHKSRRLVLLNYYSNSAIHYLCLNSWQFHVSLIYIIFSIIVCWNGKNDAVILHVKDCYCTIYYNLIYPFIFVIFIITFNSKWSYFFQFYLFIWSNFTLTIIDQRRLTTLLFLSEVIYHLFYYYYFKLHTCMDNFH